jgi:hypothetical protein
MVSFTTFFLLALFNTQVLSAGELGVGFNLQNRTPFNSPLKWKTKRMANYTIAPGMLSKTDTNSKIASKKEDKFKDPLHVNRHSYSMATQIRPFMEMETVDDTVSRDDLFTSPTATTTSWQEINSPDILNSRLPKITLLGPTPLALEVGANYVNTKVKTSDLVDVKSFFSTTIFFFRLRISYDN